MLPANFYNYPTNFLITYTDLGDTLQLPTVVLHMLTACEVESIRVTWRCKSSDNLFSLCRASAFCPVGLLYLLYGRAVSNPNSIATAAHRRLSPAYMGDGAGIRQEPIGPATYATVIV